MGLEAVRRLARAAADVVLLDRLNDYTIPPLGIMLRPEWSALLMSASSIIVATNAVLFKTAERRMGEI